MDKNGAKAIHNNCRKLSVPEAKRSEAEEKVASEQYTKAKGDLC